MRLFAAIIILKLSLFGIPAISHASNCENQFQNMGNQRGPNPEANRVMRNLAIEELRSSGRVQAGTLVAFLSRILPQQNLYVSVSKNDFLRSNSAGTTDLLVRDSESNEAIIVRFPWTIRTIDGAIDGNLFTYNSVVVSTDKKRVSILTVLNSNTPKFEPYRSLEITAHRIQIEIFEDGALKKIAVVRFQSVPRRITERWLRIRHLAAFGNGFGAIDRVLGAERVEYVPEYVMP